MSNDEKTFEDEVPEDELSEDDLSDEDIANEELGDELFDDEPVDDDALLDEDDDGGGATEGKAGDEESEGDTEALDDLEAEELEMLTDDEASETIVVDEETALRDIRRAQISMESGVPGGPTEKEFVCSVCFLVKRSSQMASRRKKICLDCAG